MALRCTRKPAVVRWQTALSGPVENNLREIGETTQEALGEMRLLLFELRPPVLQEQGLAGALRTRLQAVEARAGLVTVLSVIARSGWRPI